MTKSPISNIEREILKSALFYFLYSCGSEATKKLTSEKLNNSKNQKEEVLTGYKKDA